MQLCSHITTWSLNDSHTFPLIDLLASEKLKKIAVNQQQQEKSLQIAEKLSAYIQLDTSLESPIWKVNSKLQAIAEKFISLFTSELQKNSRFPSLAVLEKFDSLEIAKFQKENTIPISQKATLPPKEAKLKSILKNKAGWFPPAISIAKPEATISVADKATSPLYRTIL